MVYRKLQLKKTKQTNANYKKYIVNSKEEEGSENTEQRPLENKRMMGLNPAVAVILNVTDLDTSFKRQRITDC